MKENGNKKEDRTNFAMKMIEDYRQKKKEKPEEQTYSCACKCSYEESLHCTKPCPFGA